MAQNDLKPSTGVKTRTSRSNKAVQGTNDSSVKSKWSAAIRGYFTDDYLTDICQSEVLQNGRSSCVRAPVINRGYWMRFHAVNHVLTSFLDYYSRSNTETQVISLGAGYDSAYFRLTSLGHTRSSCYVEVDFPELLRKKLELICRSERLSKFFPSLNGQHHHCENSSSIIFDSPNYKMIGADLNNLQLFNDLLLSVGVDFKKPTLFLSEVVLVYLSPDSSSNVIRWAAEHFKDAIFLTYEQVYPDDAFGMFMCKHFKNIGTGLKSITEYPTIQSQAHRYCLLGWMETVASDMNYFFNNIVSPSERIQIDSTEMFDEYEEWHLKCAHYVLVTALNGTCTSLQDALWRDSSTTSLVLTESVHRHGDESCCMVTKESNGLLVYSCSVCKLPVSESILNRIEVKAECCGSSSELWNRVYGHACTRLSMADERAVLVVGGFGSTGVEGAHRRRRCASLVWIGQSSEPIKIELFESMYHTLTPLSSSEAVMFGGRTSPARPSSDLFRLGITKSEDGLCQVTRTKLEKSGSGPCARWRHSAALTTCKGSPVIVVFGGRNHDQRFLSDCWMLNCVTWQWEEIHGICELPCARHTHTSEVWKTEVLIICGLGPEQTALDSIHLLDMATYVWRKLPLFGDHFFPRYSHTSAVHRDRLILVGGVSLSHAFSPIAVVDLASGTTVNFDLKIPVEAHPAMLHNQSIVFLGEEEDGQKIRLMLLGGGGNCFSFGTHLNEFPLTLTV